MSKLANLPLATNDWMRRNLAQVNDEVIMNPKSIDITGQKFNSLTAVRDTGRKNLHLHTLWLFKCDCGNEVERPKNEVRYGRIKHCGCKKAVKIRPLKPAISKPKVLEPVVIPQPKPATNGHRDLRSVAQQIEGITAIALGLNLADIFAIHDELKRRLEATTLPLFGKEPDYQQHLSVVKAVMEFRARLEVI